MPSDPFTIRIFVADGDPEGIRFVDRMNWTGVGVVFPRERWSAASKRPELTRTGVYILVGYKEGDDELPTLYIGEGDAVRDRVESHYQKKDFWTQGYAFVTSNSGLNKAHARWLEHALIHQAVKANRSHLDNSTRPPEPPLSEAERADSRAFLQEILQVLPIMGLRAFEEPKPVAFPQAAAAISDSGAKAQPDIVVVVPANEEGFQEVFLSQNCWYAIRIGGGKLQQIKYVAGYQTKPISAVTHYAPVASIELYGEEGKYKLILRRACQTDRPHPLCGRACWPDAGTALHHPLPPSGCQEADRPVLNEGRRFCCKRQDSRDGVERRRAAKWDGYDGGGAGRALQGSRPCGNAVGPGHRGRHTTLFRWVQAYAAKLEQRARRHLRPCTGSWRVNETYVKGKGAWPYL